MSGSTEVTLFDNKGLPAHLADINENTNIVPRETIPQLSFRGKNWRVVTGGEEQMVMKTVNGQPTDEPASAVAVVILDYNKNRSRAFFEGAYDPGAPARPPTCWSNDSIVPHESVVQKQNPTCNGCKQAAKGSKITDAGKELTACSSFRRVAVVPIQNTQHEPLLLRLPQTSMWDKDAEEFAQKNFYAFDQYMDVLKKRGVNHTASVVTKIRFDPRAEYPKLLFGALAWTPPESVDDIRAQLADRDAIDKILNSDPNNFAPDPVAAAEAAAAPQPAVVATPAPAPAPARATRAPRAAAAPKAAPAPAPAPEPMAASGGNGLDDDDDGELMAAAGHAQAAPAPAPAPAPAARPAAAAAKPAARPAAAAAKPAEPVQVAQSGSGLGDLLSSWENQ